QASSTSQELVSREVRFSALSLAGGAGYMIHPARTTSFRLEAALGLAHVSGSADSGNFNVLVNGRVFPGVGFVMRVGGDILFRMEGLRPYVGAAAYRLQNSFDYGLHAGLVF